MPCVTVALVLVAGVVSAVNFWWPKGHVPASPAPDQPALPRRGSEADWSCFRGPKYGVSSWDNAPLAWDGQSGARRALENAPEDGRRQLRPCCGAIASFSARATTTSAPCWRWMPQAVRNFGGRVVADGGQGAPLPPVSDAGLALPTPACDADGVYVLFGTGDLAAFAHDGTPKWQIFLKRPEIGYGYSSSPCVSNGLVFVQFDEINGGRVLAVETATGKIKWEHPRSRGPTWSSPIIIPGPDGKPQFVVNANGSATAYDLAGKDGVGCGRRQRPGDALAHLVGRARVPGQLRLAADLLPALRRIRKKPGTRRETCATCPAPWSSTDCFS